MITMNMLRRLAVRKFEYGECDCFTFTRQLVSAHHGVDILFSYDYEDERTARRLMAKNKGLDSLTTDKLGLPLDDVSLAVEGDVAVADLGDGLSLGFVTDGDRVLFKTKEGIASVPLSECSKAWRVDRCLLQSA